jgi:hypothetical protein
VIAEGVLPVLQVPSAVIPTEFKFLLNPSHKEFRKLRIGKPPRFRFDRQIVDSAGPPFRLFRE